MSELVAAPSEHIAEQVRLDLRRWAATCPRFHSFVQNNKSKINKKLREAKEPEDILDVRLEFEEANHLCKTFDLVYEPYGAKGPDFQVQTDRLFDIEVKRIREMEEQVRFMKCMEGIGSAVKSIPSSVSVSMDFLGVFPKCRDDIREFVDQLEDNLPQVIEHVQEMVLGASQGNSPCFIPGSVPEWPTGCRLSINKNGGNPDTSTSWAEGLWPVFFTNQESLKLSEKILKALKQFRPGTPGILILRSDRFSEDIRDLDQAIDGLFWQVADQNDDYFRNHGFDSVASFLACWPRLSAIVARTMFMGGSTLRENRNAAVRIPTELRECLESTLQ